MSKINDVNNNYNSNISRHSYPQQNIHPAVNNIVGVNSPAVILNTNNQMSTNNMQQYGNIDPAVKILDDTLNLIRTGDREIDAKGENVVLICGDTGAGKSTLINYLIGNELVSVKREGSRIHDINVKNNSSSIKIGHGLISETFMPNKAKQPNSNVVYYDCPGFSDSRGPVKDIANAFAINKIFASAEKIQIMLVIEETSLIGSNRGQNFKELFNRVSELFDHKDDFIKNTVLVFTKVKETEDFAAEITRIINANDKGEESILSDSQKSLLERVIREAKIVTFSSPTRAGNIDLEERQAILAASNNTPYATKPKVNITVSTSSLLTLQKLTETVNKQIKSNVKKLGELLTTNLDKIPLSKLEEIKANINQLNLQEFTSDDEIVEFIEIKIVNLVTHNSPDANKDKITAIIKEVQSLVGYFGQFFTKILSHTHVESDKLKGAFIFHTLNAFEKAIASEVLKNNQEKLKEVNAALDKNQKEFKEQLDKQAAIFADTAKDSENKIAALAEQLKLEKQQRVDLDKLVEKYKNEVSNFKSTIDDNRSLITNLNKEVNNLKPAINIINSSNTILCKYDDNKKILEIGKNDFVSHPGNVYDFSVNFDSNLNKMNNFILEHVTFADLILINLNNKKVYSGYLPNIDRLELRTDKSYTIYNPILNRINDFYGVEINHNEIVSIEHLKYRTYNPGTNLKHLLRDGINNLSIRLAVGGGGSIYLKFKIN